MKIKMVQIIQIKDILSKLIDEKMPIETAYKIMKITKQAEEESNFYSEKLKEIIQKYAAVDEKNNFVKIGDNIKIKPGLEEDCNKEMSNLENIEVSLPDIKINLKELNSIQLSPREIFLLEPIIE